MLPLLMCGCDSFLDQVPDDRTKLDDVESVKALLVSAYPNGHYMMAGELMSDNSDDRGSWGASIFPEMQVEAYFWEVSTQNVQDAPMHYWTRLYEAIAAANHAIEAIELNGGGPEYDPYLGEAKMARAFSHFLLVTFWAKPYNPATAATDPGIPYVTKPEKQALVKYKRNTVKEVYEMIEKDITEGFPLLSDNAYSVPKYHFTKAAANAFMARFYLFRGEDGDWDKVIEHTSAILGAGANFKSQLRDYAGKYLPVASSVEDYSKLYTSFGEPAILMLTNAPSLWYWSSFYGRYGMTDSNMRNDVFGAAMVRNHGWIGTARGSEPFYMMMKIYQHIHVTDPGGDSGMPYTMCPILTVEEAAFNRAEAYVMQGRFDEAIADLNVWLSTRTRNYVENLHRLGMKEVVTSYIDERGREQERREWVYDPEYALNEVVTFYKEREATSIKLEPWYKDELDSEQMYMLQYITDLRRKEFLQEGMRWFDVKRFRIEVVHRIFESNEQHVLTRDDPRREWQIPATAIEYGIEPNPR